MKKAYLAMAVLILTLPLLGQDPLEIMKKSRDVVKVSSFEALSTLTISDRRGNTRIRKNTMASKVFEDGTEKRIIKFIDPPEVKGTGILIYDREDKSDDMWIYLPALRKTRRIVSSEKSGSFMGSEFSNADMTAPGIDDFSYEILGSEKLDGIECWKISSSPTDMDLEDEYGYSKSISWVGKNDYLVRKSDYYNFSGELVKTIDNLDYKLLDPKAGKYMISERVAENHMNGRVSIMKMEKVQIAETNDEYFSVAYLEK